MKIQCSCGAKYNVEVTPEMAHSSSRFVCAACGLDASEFVNALIRQELASAASTTEPSSVPAASPAPPVAPAPAPPAAQLRVHKSQPVRVEVPAADPDAASHCSRHPSEILTDKCFVCSKPICPKCMQLFGYLCSPLCRGKADSHGLEVPVYEGQASVVEARLWRRTARLVTAAAVILVAALGVWIWYEWFGSTPKTVFSVRFTAPSFSGESFFSGKDQIIFLHGDTLARHDVKQNKEIWSRQLIDMKLIEAEVAREIKSAKELVDRANNEAWEHMPKVPSVEKLTKELVKDAAAEMELRLHGQNIWVASQGKLSRYDWDTGKTLKEIPLKAGFSSMIPHGDEMLLLEYDDGRQFLTHVNLNNGDSNKEQIGGPFKPALVQALNNGTNLAAAGAGSSRGAGLPIGKPGKDGAKPLDPGKVAEQAQHMSLPARIALPAVLSNARNQERTAAELEGDQRSLVSGRRDPKEDLTLLPTQEGFVQFSVKLLESKITAHDAMRARPTKSTFNGPPSIANSTEMANEILNDMQRDRGGDIVHEDESRYQVTLRDAGGPEGWTGEVIGSPSLYPLRTVKVLTSRKTLMVFDKQNKKLWQSALSYDVRGGLGALEAENATYGQGPCVEQKDSLYVFDEGILTAFELGSGNVRWRYPSVGIIGIFFDDKGMIYVNTTTATHEKLKFSRQIDLGAKENAVVVKLEPKTGKVLWNAEPGGLVNYCSGKFLYTVQSYMPPEPDEDDPYHAETGFETPPYVRIRRINPSNGRLMWEHFQQRAPLDVQFDKNSIRLVFKKEVQVLKFFTL